MGTLMVAMLAVSLAMDAFAVSIILGAADRQIKKHQALRIAYYFGVFQAVMPLLGFLAVSIVKDYIYNIDHWVAFGILTVLGVKMIWESFKIKEEMKGYDHECTKTMLLLSVATSIDAFAVGITISLLRYPLILAVLIIGVITAVLSFIGTQIGVKIGHFFENRLEAAAGLILIGLGIKVLLQHFF